MPLDIGVGILLSLGVAEYFGIEATPFLVAFGIACTLLPDIDVVTLPFGKWYHRTVTHYPIVYLPLAVLAYIFLDPVYATIFTLCVYAHLIHDTAGIGWWGIAWLWPFSKKRLLLFPEKERRENTGSVAWLSKETQAIPEQVNNTKWIKHYYLQPNPIAYIEYGTLVIALVVLVAYFT